MNFLESVHENTTQKKHRTNLKKKKKVKHWSHVYSLHNKCRNRPIFMLPLLFYADLKTAALCHLSEGFWIACQRPANKKALCKRFITLHLCTEIDTSVSNNITIIATYFHAAIYLA